MATEAFTNFPATTVPAGASGTLVTGQADTWVVSDSSAFPAASAGVTQFHVADTAQAATSELIEVTNVSGTTWSVIRGAEDTTPVAHSAGFTITGVITAGWLNDTSAIQAGTLPTVGILNLEDLPSGILRGSVQSINGDIWIMSNATYDTDNGNWYRIDITKAAFGLQIQGQNNIYGEPVPGTNLWVAQPESYTLIRGGGSPTGAQFTAVGGWELGYTLTSQRQLTIGGGGIEVDGYGTYPYTRVAANTTGTVLSRRIGGMVRNAYTALDGADDTTQESWFWGYTDQYTGGGGTVPGSNVWCVAYMPANTLPFGGVFDEYLTVSAAGVVGVPGNLTVGGTVTAAVPLAVTSGGMGGTAATAYAVVTGGTSATAPLQQVASLGSSGQVLTSNGAGQLPSWQPATGGTGVTFPFTVPEGGTGGTQATAYALLAGGTSPASPLQQVAGAGTLGQVLTSQGAGQLPAWVNNTGGSVSFPITVPEGGTGGTQATAYAVVLGGTTATSPLQQVPGLGTSGQLLASQGAGQPPQWVTSSGGTVSYPITVPEGGTGGTQATAYALVAGGTSATTPFQQVSGLGGAGQVLTSQGAGSLPTWTTVSAGGAPAVDSITTSGTNTYTLAAASFGAFNVTLGASSVPTFDFTGLSAGSDVSFTVVLTQPVPGGVSVTWGTPVTWLGGGSAPTLNTGTGAISVFVFESVDGASWLGTLVTGPSFNGAATSPVTITASAGESVISSATIPAGLPPDATYRVTTWGTIATLTTSGTTIMKTRLGGLAGTQLQTFTSASLSSSSTYNWRSVADVTLQVPGTAAIWCGDLTAIQNVQGSAASTYLASPGTVAANSTTAQVFAVTLSLSGTASTATCLGSTWERVC